MVQKPDFQLASESCIASTHRRRAQGWSPAAILELGREILEKEARAIRKKKESLGPSFVNLAERLFNLRGKTGVTGVGKSGIIGEKIAATLSSTGTPALFLKPVDALHGDLGVLRGEDYLIAISNSGETAEVLAVVESARALGIGVAAMTGNLNSSLARAAEIALDIGVEVEACPLDLAPTASTTVTLAVGDALAMVLLEMRGFTPEQYARFHPGGPLGQRLKHQVKNLMRSGDKLPLVRSTSTLAEALAEMTQRENLGVTLVVDPEGLLAGILTDGDLRRILLKSKLLKSKEGGGLELQKAVGDCMTRRPKVIEPEAPVSEALRLMEVHSITSLAVINPLSRPVGIIHLHDILGRGKILL
ncbi:MAG: KpsF/GutQ family sugar-phosphate isomerase [Planctomycetes bacterium]|nr:KpsF/GutQ family sugar-phosphate isomerase [Planctomycetota bacterium]